MMQRLRVEPYSSYLERRRKGPIYPVTLAGGFLFLSGLPPFEPSTGEIKRLSFERQAEIVLVQMQECLEAAGSSFTRVLKCNVYCTPEPSDFAIFNDVYARYFPTESPSAHLPARTLVHRPVRHRSRLRGGGLVDLAVGKFDRQSRRLSSHFSTANPINNKRDENQDEKQKYIRQLQ